MFFQWDTVKKGLDMKNCCHTKNVHSLPSFLKWYILQYTVHIRFLMILSIFENGEIKTLRHLRMFVMDFGVKMRLEST